MLCRMFARVQQANSKQIASCTIWFGIILYYITIIFFTGLQVVNMDSTNLYGVGHIHRGMQPHNDMLVYHTNKIHVVKVPVVVQDQLLEAIPVIRAFNDGLMPYSGNVHSAYRLMQIINIY